MPCADSRARARCSTTGPAKWRRWLSRSRAAQGPAASISSRALRSARTEPRSHGLRWTGLRGTGSRGGGRGSRTSFRGRR
eukprot:1277437-Rhodomonas_salina.3